MAFLANIDETLAWGRGLADSLQSGDVIALVGTLGAGKTHVTKGITAGVGSTAEVSSPTFTLVHEYLGGRLPIFHFDFYRLEHPAELLGLGWDDYLDAGGVVIVEWADRFPEMLPSHTRWYTLALQGEGREVNEAPGA